jgi:2-polyprenyl-3-methyl-5-hydroxy-6-metoxy-1,4-benzoquinol methylase
VLEHVERPQLMIATVAALLKPAGIALITEAFGLVTPNLATHLASNLKYDGRTPLLFAKVG